jgi:hypothetical protein
MALDSVSRGDDVPAPAVGDNLNAQARREGGGCHGHDMSTYVVREGVK